MPADRNPASAPPADLAAIPAITDTINRCALLGSLAQQERAGQYADHYITPDLSQIAFRRFDRIAEASEIGYRAAMTALAGWTAP